MTTSIVRLSCVSPMVVALSMLWVGYHESGTWEDDPKHWQRIFREPKPEHVEVERSWYWRSPDFT